MVDDGPGNGNLKSKVFFVWGSTCTLAAIFAYFMVPETKGLSLEQVDRMLEETTPRTSARWTPHSQAEDVTSLGSAEKTSVHIPASEHHEHRV